MKSKISLYVVLAAAVLVLVASGCASVKAGVNPGANANTSQLNKIGQDIAQAANDIWGSIKGTASNILDGIGGWFVQLNQTVQTAAEKIPGNIGTKAVTYPWISIILALVFGILLSRIFRRPCQPCA